MSDPSHRKNGRTCCWLRFEKLRVVLRTVPGSTIPPCLLRRRLGDFMPPTCPGRTCTPPGSTTNAPSLSPCTGTSSSTSLFRGRLHDATVSILIFVICIYSFVDLFAFFRLKKLISRALKGWYMHFLLEFFYFVFLCVFLFDLILISLLFCFSFRVSVCTCSSFHIYFSTSAGSCIVL